MKFTPLEKILGVLIFAMIFGSLGILLFPNLFLYVV